MSSTRWRSFARAAPCCRRRPHALRAVAGRACRRSARTAGPPPRGPGRMTRLVAWLLSSVISVASPYPAPRIQDHEAPQPTVRFHHIHYRIGDPSAAISHTAARLKGERVVVPGIGVGVRAGDTYLIFDRLDEMDPPLVEQMPVPGAYLAAVAWLGRHGVAVAEVDAVSQPLLAALPGER